MIAIERFVFVCPSLETAFSSRNWGKFCISPIRQTRAFIRSRYVVFNNVMLELLQITEEEEGRNFVFFEEWRNANQPTWVATGCKVENLDLALVECKKFGIVPSEEFTATNSNFEKGFKHKSCLLSKNWNGKRLYLTEYDDKFFKERNAAISTEPDKRDTYYATIPSLKLEDPIFENSFNFENKSHFTLEVVNQVSTKSIVSHDFNWIVLHESNHTCRI